MVIDKYFKLIGEWHKDEIHGIAKQESIINGYCNWGQFKHGKREGFMTEQKHDEKVDYFQYKNGIRNGYGIYTGGDGVYRGEFKDSMFNGYGFMKYNNNDEYDGQWKGH